MKLPLIPPPSPPPRFVRDLVFPAGGPDHGARRKHRVLPSFLAMFLIGSVLLNTTAVFADDAPAPDVASSTPAVSSDASLTTDASSTIDIPPPAIPDQAPASTTPEAATSTLVVPTEPTSTDDLSDLVASSSVASDTIQQDVAPTSTPTSTATSTIIATSTAESNATSSEAGDSMPGDSATSTVLSDTSDITDTVPVTDVASTSVATTTVAASTTDVSTTEVTSTAPAPVTLATSTIPAAPAVDVDQLRSQVRSELEAQMQSAYDAQLKAALADEQNKLNAAEQTDEGEMKNELTAQIAQQLRAGCLTFDDGSYFCVNPAQATGTYPAPAPYANVYAAKDPQTGSQQIFMQTGSRAAQITHTSYDNIQPVWNKDQTLIVWQGLVNDRWQIFAYESATGATQMISDGASNNINPTIDGGRIAWQGWDNEKNNWEVFSAENAGSVWQISEITHDAWPDIEPQLAAGLLAWQSYQSGSWQIFVDNLATGEISQVSGGNGINTDPKFLLTWSNQENGQAQTLQYDISSGAVSVLGAAAQLPMPAPLPVAPADKSSSGALPTGSSSSTSSSTASSKSQGDGDNLLSN